MSDLTNLVLAAKAVADRAVVAPGAYGHSALIPWSLIYQLRKELDALKDSGDARFET